MSIFVHIDCCDYMVLDFRQQLKTTLKDVEMSGGSKWERGGAGVRGVYTPFLLGVNIGSFKKDLILLCFHFRPFVGSVLSPNRPCIWVG